MVWSAAADAVMVVHFAFIAYIVVGGLAIAWRRVLVWPHLATLAYGLAIQVIGFTCPLTPLEKELRQAAGEAVYDGGFIGHYITPVLYPGELTFVVKLVLVGSIAAINVAAYGWVFGGRRPAPHPPAQHPIEGSVQVGGHRG